MDEIIDFEDAEATLGDKKDRKTTHMHKYDVMAIVDPPLGCRFGAPRGASRVPEKRPRSAKRSPTRQQHVI